MVPPQRPHVRYNTFLAGEYPQISHLTRFCDLATALSKPAGLIFFCGEAAATFITAGKAPPPYR